MEGTVTLTVTLPTELQQSLDEVTREEGISTSELVGDALKEYLFLRRFRMLRERMIMKAQEQGIYTDQDVFERVS